MADIDMLLDVSQVKGFSIIPTDKTEAEGSGFIPATSIHLGLPTSLLTHRYFRRPVQIE